MTNERTIEGPEVAIASPMITKMPVPMMAPRPSAVRSSAPTARRSSVLFSCVSSTSRSTGLVAKSPLRVRVAMQLLSRRRDDEDRAARPADQLDRRVAEQASRHRPARRGAADDEVRVAVLGEQQDAAHDGSVRSEEHTSELQS